MAAYAIDDHVTAEGSVEVVMAALEVLLDAIDNTKTIRYVDIIPMPNRKFKGVLLVDAA
jgi:hypothetical protein